MLSSRRTLNSKMTTQPPTHAGRPQPFGNGNDAMMTRAAPLPGNDHGSRNSNGYGPSGAKENTMNENVNNSNIARCSMDGLRTELRKAVHFTHAKEGDPADGQARKGFADAELECFRDLSIRCVASPVECHDRALAKSELEAVPMLSDEEEIFLMEAPDVSDFQGSSVHRLGPRNESSGPLIHKASSFSGVARQRMVPCSPPVPIPQKHLLRRNSVAVSTSSRASSMSTLIPSHDTEYSRTQCEARLWDEYWNYKLSLESRESFEASSNQRDASQSASTGSNNNTPHSQKRRTDSEASTEDTTRDDQSADGCDPDDADANVFDMDDF